MQCVLSAKVIYAYICKIETHALYVSYSQCDVYVIVTISHLYTIFPFCIYIASILNAMYMHLKQTHLYAIRPTTRYITHSKNRNWSKCDVHRILNCDIYRIYFLNAMYVASACGVLRCHSNPSCAGAYDSGFVGRASSMWLLGEFGILLFCSPGFWDVGGLLRALSSPGG